jgi:hypothetical protein
MREGCIVVMSLQPHIICHLQVISSRSLRDILMKGRFLGLIESYEIAANSWLIRSSFVSAGIQVPTTAPPYQANIDE